METKGSQESLQSRLSFFHHGRLFSSDRDDSSDSDDYLETGLKKALNTRENKSPSMTCILEAVKICLKSNHSVFKENFFLQIHGTAMGPKNACSYADLAMGEIDVKAKFLGPIKPSLWWRYRDDVFDLWQQGLPALHQFTDYINSLYPTIKFELVFSERELHVLDLTLYLIDGFIRTDVYSKPTDSHLYLQSLCFF